MQAVDHSFLKVIKQIMTLSESCCKSNFSLESSKKKITKCYHMATGCHNWS